MTTNSWYSFKSLGRFPFSASPDMTNRFYLDRPLTWATQWLLSVKGGILCKISAVEREPLGLSKHGEARPSWSPLGTIATGRASTWTQIREEATKSWMKRVGRGEEIGTWRLGPLCGPQSPTPYHPPSSIHQTGWCLSMTHFHHNVTRGSSLLEDRVTPSWYVWTWGS